MMAIDESRSFMDLRKEGRVFYRKREGRPEASMGA